jgi:Raf kinase inhibitor-like YbhB/YbcL family protein
MKSLPLLWLLGLCFGLASCGSPSTPMVPAPNSPQPAPPTTATPPAKTDSSFALNAPAFAQNASIPARYTCSGENISPALEWTAPPSGTKSIALIVDDPDAPGGTWVHWVIYNLPAETRGLPEGVSKANDTANTLPQGSIQGRTSFNRTGYGGPCPPSGQHHYIFHLYAADTLFNNPYLDKAGLLKALEGHILASSELTGVYQK